MSKAKDAVRYLRQQQVKAMEDTLYARKHNFEFEALACSKLESQLSEIACKLEDILGTGYVGPN